MSVASQVVEIRLPRDIVLAEDELRELEASLQSMLGSEGGRAYQAVARKLEAAGWKTTATFGWCVEARRGRDRERAVGRTLDEAYAELYQLTRLDESPAEF